MLLKRAQDLISGVAGETHTIEMTVSHVVREWLACYCPIVIEDEDMSSDVRDLASEIAEQINIIEDSLPVI